MAYVTDESDKEAVKGIRWIQSQLPPNRKENGTWLDSVWFYKQGDKVPTVGEVRGKVVLITDGMFTKYEDHCTGNADYKIPYVRRFVENGNKYVQDWIGLRQPTFIKQG